RPFLMNRRRLAALRGFAFLFGPVEAGAGEVFADLPETRCGCGVGCLRGDLRGADGFAASLLKALRAVVAAVLRVVCGGGVERGERAFGVGVEEGADDVADDVAHEILEGGVLTALE